MAPTGWRVTPALHLLTPGCHRVVMKSSANVEHLTVMSTQDSGFDLELSRRKLLAAAGIGGGAALAASVFGTGAAEAAPNAPPVAAPSISTPPGTTPPVTAAPAAAPPVAGAASAVRLGCVLGDGSLLAHLATGSPSACRARASRWRARARGRGSRGQLHRRQGRPGGLRLPCEDRPIAA